MTSRWLLLRSAEPAGTPAAIEIRGSVCRDFPKVHFFSGNPPGSGYNARPKTIPFMSEEVAKDTDSEAEAEADPNPDTGIPISTPGEEDAQRGEEAPPEESIEPDAAHWKDVAARNQAELDNYRKRMARGKAEQMKWANANLLGELLSVIDSFQMGLDAARMDDKESVITQGMEMVQRQLDEFLGNQGVVEVAATGEGFDPNQHEAISHEHHPEVAEGVIISQVRRGFRLHDRLLRASNVIVSKGPGDTEEAGQPES